MIELVPRGTRLVGLRFTQPMYQAIVQNLKTQTRRPLTAGNCQMTRGDFEQIDHASGRPDGVWPVSSLRARVEGANGDRRSVTITSRVKANTFLWCRRGQSGPAAWRENAEFYLCVEAVAPMRLNDISDEDALREGVLIFCPPEIRQSAPTTAQAIAGAYDFQMRQLGKKNAARWRAGAIHQDVRGRGEPLPRDCFALLWESINGLQSWSLNPWVWRYSFRKVAPAEIKIAAAGAGPQAAERAP